MKNYELVEFVEKFSTLKGLGGLEFTKPIFRNFNLAKIELEAIESIHQYSDGYMEFLGKKEDLIKKYCKKDEGGNPIFKNIPAGNKMYKSYDIDQTDEYKEEFQKLLAEYKEVIDVQTDKEKKYEEAMLKECDLKLHMVDEDALPSNITFEQLEIVNPFIKYKD